MTEHSGDESPELFSPEDMVSYHDELVLEKWLESSSSGNTCAFKVPTNTERHQFREFTIKDKNHAGQRFSATLVPIDAPSLDGRTVVRSGVKGYYDPIDVELLLARWDNSPTTGRSVNFIIKFANGEDGHPLEKFAIHTGKAKSNNQHFMATLVQLDDADQPVKTESNHLQEKDSIPEPKVKKHFEDYSPAQQCGIFCGDPLFSKYLMMTRNSYMQESIDAADCIRRLFHIKSRSELKEPENKEKWAWIVADFKEWKSKQDGF